MATRHSRVRILLYNVGYATELDGSLKSYLFGFWHYLYTPPRVVKRVRQSIYSILSAYKPDLCCFVEIHSRHGFLRPRLYAFHDIEVKYDQESYLVKAPFFRDNCNGFYARRKFAFRKLYFKHGTKRLIYEIELRPHLRLLLAHFSLEKEVRKKQFQELRRIIETGSPAIVCGDFNIFDGFAELEALSRACNLRIVNTKANATYPAKHPSKVLDLFLCPPQVRYPKVTVLQGIQESDHLPVVLEMELPPARRKTSIH